MAESLIQSIMTADAHLYFSNNGILYKLLSNYNLSKHILQQQRKIKEIEEKSSQVAVRGTREIKLILSPLLLSSSFSKYFC